MKKIPYGISDYKTIVDENYLYIDKTNYIEVIENLDEPYIFLLRPRRFGKSLFASVLEYYYDVKHKEIFNDLFKNTYIAKNKTEKASSYYVLKFNFSGISTDSKDSMINGFKRSVRSSINEFLKKYSLKYNFDMNMMPVEIIEDFFIEMKYELNAKIYIIIDEYDHFANELLSFKPELFENTFSKTGFVRKWYESIKNATSSGLVQRIFITGIAPITLDSMTSGFNIGKNKSLDSNFNECFGFTENEVREILTMTIGEYIEIDKEISTLKKYYNGYKFSHKAKNTVFNSDMILYYVSEYKINKEAPFQMIDENIASDYTKISQLFEIKNRSENIEILKEIVENIPQNTVITTMYNLQNKFDTDDFNSLLFYLGFLTINQSEMGQAELVVPNYVIKELYFDYFTKIISEESDCLIGVSSIRKSIIEISKDKKIDKFLEIISNVLKKLSFRDNIKFDEKYVKLIMISYLMLSKIYYVKSEYEVEDGYIDIALLARPSVTVKFNGIIELKYIAKSKFTKELLEEKINDARKQILKYMKSNELSTMNNLVKWIIIFKGHEVVYVEEVI